MMRLIMPIIIVGVAISVFFMFTDTLYNDISSLRAEVASYNDALNNSKALENQRDKLTAKYNAIDPDSLDKLEKFLPSTVDNIRLILEIEKIASPYGMILKDVKYDASASTSAPSTSVAGGGVAKAAPKDYGIFDLEFSTLGTYSNFVNFTKDLENNLRLVDISSIDFSSDSSSQGIKVSSTPDSYKYDFHIKTYWLKN